jgi:diacylglycerol kinase (ATP)
MARLPQIDQQASLEASLTLKGRLKSFRCAIKGVAVMIQSQHNAWIHALATVVVCAAGVFFGLSRSEWCWIVVAIVVVWMAEALNTAFEFLADFASPTFHPIAGKAKDVAAGAVLIAAIGSAVIGIMIFGPHIFTLFRK